MADIAPKELILSYSFQVYTMVLLGGTLPCETKMQYLFTLQVGRYCPLALQSGTGLCTWGGLSHSNIRIVC